MKLLDYMKGLDETALNRFATACKTPLGSLWQIARGHRPCMEWRAINIERESERNVTCEELCPNADWAYIRHSGIERRAKDRRTA